jgi:putative transposase
MTRGEGAFPETGRKIPCHGAHIDLGGPNIFFVTVNAKDRVPWISQPTVHLSLRQIWSERTQAWRIGYYLLMPDHLHFFCAPFNLRFGIDEWIEYWKSSFRRMHLDQPWIWQRRAFHHRLRGRAEYEEKLSYTRMNPCRHGLVKDPDDWPLQGRVHDIWWIGD